MGHILGVLGHKSGPFSLRTSWLFFIGTRSRVHIICFIGTQFCVVGTQNGLSWLVGTGFFSSGHNFGVLGHKFGLFRSLGHDFGLLGHNVGLLGHTVGLLARRRGGEEGRAEREGQRRVIREKVSDQEYCKEEGGGAGA